MTVVCLEARCLGRRLRMTPRKNYGVVFFSFFCSTSGSTATRRPPLRCHCVKSFAFCHHLASRPQARAQETQSNQEPSDAKACVPAASEMLARVPLAKHSTDPPGPMKGLSGPKRLVTFYHQCLDRPWQTEIRLRPSPSCPGVLVHY